jgi:CheY-like chemotaxis protein/MinD-like ATPase involved in chromosome partitioning or flagellar assembly
MVVDDSDPVRRTIEEMLGLDGGFDVVGEAADGPGAVELAARLRPDAVLLDINLPGFDGVRAAARIAEVCSARVIMVSVENGLEYFRRAMQAGACDYLVKPFTPEGLAQALRRACNEAGSRGRRIGIVGAKGGVGASTLVANLAVSLAVARGDLRVAVADGGGELAVQDLLLGLRVGAPVDLGGDPDRLAASLPRSPDVPVALLPPLSPAAGFADALDALAMRFDVVVVDLPVRWDEPAAAALAGADRVVVVAEPTVPCLRAARQVLSRLQERCGVPADAVWTVLNRARRPGTVPAAAASHVLGVSPAAVLPEDPAVGGAANLGWPLPLHRSRGPYLRALRTLAARLDSPQEWRSREAASAERAGLEVASHGDAV